MVLHLDSNLIIQRMRSIEEVTLKQFIQHRWCRTEIALCKRKRQCN